MLDQLLDKILELEPMQFVDKGDADDVTKEIGENLKKNDMKNDETQTVKTEFRQLRRYGDKMSYIGYWDIQNNRPHGRGRLFSESVIEEAMFEGGH